MNGSHFGAMDLGDCAVPLVRRPIWSIGDGTGEGDLTGRDLRTKAPEAASRRFRDGFGAAVSHRSGDTSTASITGVTVVIAWRMTTAGPPAHDERAARYNRLLAIETEPSDPPCGLGLL